MHPMITIITIVAMRQLTTTHTVLQGVHTAERTNTEQVSRLQVARETRLAHSKITIHRIHILQDPIRRLAPVRRLLLTEHTPRQAPVVLPLPIGPTPRQATNPHLPHKQPHTDSPHKGHTPRWVQQLPLLKMVAMQLSTRQWLIRHRSLAPRGLGPIPLRPRLCIALHRGTHSIAQIRTNIDNAHPRSFHMKAMTPCYDENQKLALLRLMTGLLSHTDHDQRASRGLVHTPIRLTLISFLKSLFPMPWIETFYSPSTTMYR